MSFDKNTKRRVLLQTIKETLIADFISIDDTNQYVLNVILDSLKFKRKIKKNN